MTDDHLSSLSIVIYDGHFDKIHYALAMASSAAAIETTVTLFFTMDAAHALMVSKDGTPAWRALPVSQSSHQSGGEMDDFFVEQIIGTFEDLLSACVEMGVTIMICEMGLKARKLSTESMRTDVPITPGGLVTFLSRASKDGSIIFI